MSSNNSVLLNYMSSLSANYEHSVYLLPWKNAVLVQNYFEADGNLVNLKDSKTKNPWVLLEACQFTYKDSTFVKFVCQHCNKVLKDMKPEQHPEKLVSLLCYHSKALHHILDAEDQGYEFPPENHPNDILRCCYMKKFHQEASCPLRLHCLTWRTGRFLMALEWLK